MRASLRMKDNQREALAAVQDVRKKLVTTMTMCGLPQAVEESRRDLRADSRVEAGWVGEISRFDAVERSYKLLSRRPWKNQV